MEEQLNLFDFQIETIKVEPKSRLTPRQWALYRLIKENTEAGRKTTQREIYEKVEGYSWNEKSAANHDHCPMIWNDIMGEEGLNFSPEIQKTIVYKNYEAWVGNKEEVQEFIDQCWRLISPKLKRYWNLVNRIKNDGQGQIFSCQGDLIKEDSEARGYIEAFLFHNPF